MTVNMTKEVQIGKGITVHMEDTNHLGLVRDPGRRLDLGPMDVMIISSLGLPEVEAVVAVIVRTAMMMIDMMGLRDGGTVRTSANVNTTVWYVNSVIPSFFTGPFYSCGLDFTITLPFLGPICYCCRERSLAEDN